MSQGNNYPNNKSNDRRDRYQQQGFQTQNQGNNYPNNQSNDRRDRYQQQGSQAQNQGYNYQNTQQNDRCDRYQQQQQFQDENRFPNNCYNPNQYGQNNFNQRQVRPPTEFQNNYEQIENSYHQLKYEKQYHQEERIRQDYQSNQMNQKQRNSKMSGKDQNQQVHEQIQKILQYIFEGSNKINKWNGNSIMLIGNTGSGKTTLSAYLSNKELICKNDEDGFTYYSYRNQQSGQGEIGHRVSVSETTIPNKFDGEYWDCPGFQDTNGVDSDISNAFFFKKIADQSSGVKFILVLEGQSLESRGVGDCRGAGMRRLLETLFSLQSKTGLQLQHHLLIVLTKVNPENPKSFFQKKLRTFFQNACETMKFEDENEDESTEEFFEQLCEVPLELFPIFKQGDGTSVPSFCRTSIINTLSQIQYTNNKINFPLSKECISRIKEIIRFSLDKVKQEFSSLMGILSKIVQNQNTTTLKQLKEILDRINLDQEDSQLINIKCFEFIKSNIIQKFNGDNELLNQIQQIENDIRFQFKEVIDGVLKIGKSTIFNSIKLRDFENDFEQLNTVVQQVIKRREDEEAHKKEIRQKDQQTADMEEMYLEQSEKQNLKNNELQNSLHQESQLRQKEQHNNEVLSQKQEYIQKQLHDAKEKQIIAGQQHERQISQLQQNMKEQNLDNQQRMQKLQDTYSYQINQLENQRRNEGGPGFLSMVGAVVGGIMGGPAGAVAGAAFGQSLSEI